MAGQFMGSHRACDLLPVGIYPVGVSLRELTVGASSFNRGSGVKLITMSVMMIVGRNNESHDEIW